MRREKKIHLLPLVLSVSAAVLLLAGSVIPVCAESEAMSYMLEQYEKNRTVDGQIVAKSSYSLPVFAGNGPSIASLNARIDELRAHLRECEASIGEEGERIYRERGEIMDLFCMYTTEESFHRGDYRTLYIYYEMYSGGVHGGHSEEFLNVDITRGLWLALTDAINSTEAEFEELLCREIRAGGTTHLLNDPESIVAERSLQDYKWAFSDEGIAVHFAEYEIAPYASGMLCYVIPYDDLNMKVDPGRSSTGPAEDAEYREKEETPPEAPQTAQEQNVPENPAGGDDTAIHSYAIVIGDITWEQARKKTLSEGCHLARLNTPQEFDAVTAQADAEGKGDYYLFIGAHRDNQNVYHWIDDNGGFLSEDLTDPGYYCASRWMRNEPSFYDPERKTNTGEVLQEACLVLKKFEGKWVLNDVPGDLVGSYNGWLAGKVGYVAEYD